MRPRLQNILICGVIICILLFLVKKHRTPTYPPNFILLDDTVASDSQNKEITKSHGTEVQALTCLVNGYATAGCYLINNTRGVVDVEIVKYWHEVTGHINKTAKSMIIQSDETEFFEDSKPYSWFGEYMDMGYSQPEARKFVQMLDPDLNIPISCQWNPAGHHYVIQVAQFGLSHFSQLIMLEKTRIKETKSLSREQPVVELNTVTVRPTLTNGASWKCQLPKRSGTNIFPHGTCIFSGDNILYGGGHLPSIVFRLNATPLNTRLDSIFVTGHDWSPGVRLILRIKPKGGILFDELHYSCSTSFGDGDVVVADRKWALGYTPERTFKVVYFLNKCGHFIKNEIILARKINLDILKGTSVLMKKQSEEAHLSDTPEFIIQSVQLVLPSNGSGGVITDLTLFEMPKSFENGIDRGSVHGMIVKRFLEARLNCTVNWLLDTQASDGSWKVSARREFTKAIALQPGWCSAMGQGQGISLLVRMFQRTGDQRFLKASFRAVAPFTRSVHQQMGSTKCAVRSDFLGQAALPFFEEYPASTSVFVLNGFISSLVGLFDLSQLDHANVSEVKTVKHLFDDGVATLYKVLPLYDSGSGSFYDLRHLSLQHSQRHSDKPPRLLTRDIRPLLGDADFKDLLKAGPNRARPSYHHLHLKQLQVLGWIAPQHRDLWSHTLDRWLAYTWGFHAGHN